MFLSFCKGKEGGARVDAFARWPGMIEKDSYVGDMIHVADLYTSFARIAGAPERRSTSPRTA